jgi:protein-S-isoprenylcysteine O-methyltransferase Ste14
VGFPSLLQKTPHEYPHVVRPLVYSSPLAAAAFFTTFGVWAVGELVLQVRNQAMGEADPTRIGMVAGSVGGTTLAFVLAGHGALPGPSWLPVVIGLSVAWLGMGVRAWSVRTLGEFFTVDVTVAATQRVIDDGPYARVRHPSYTGMLMAILGFGIALDSWGAAAAALFLPLAAVVNRIRHEEAMLRRELGEPYEAYANRTARLVPGIW